MSDKNRQEHGLPVPHWLIAIPLVGVMLAAVLFASGDPGPLSVGIFILSACVLGYLYLYMIAVWRRRRNSYKP
jgi:hypothetical protein